MACIILLVFVVQVISTPVLGISDALEFFVLGDWGKGGNAGNILNTLSSSQVRLSQYPKVAYARDDSYMSVQNKDDKNRKQYTYQAAVAETMSDWSNRSDVTPSFVVAVGDNFYDDGVQSATDSTWDTLWKDVYLSNYTNLRVPWFPVLGNHDYGYGLTGALAQVDRYKEDTDAISAGLWRFSGFNYSQVFEIPCNLSHIRNNTTAKECNSTGKLVMIFIDTTTLAPSENRCCNEEGGISVEEQSSRIQNQLSNIRRMLTEAVLLDPTWLVVVGHYPIFSSGEHGDTSELLTYLQPLIEEFNVSAYIAGHDHISEHLSANSTEHFVAGAGAMTDAMGETPSRAVLRWSGTGYSAFAVVRATHTSMNISFVHWNGTVMYSHVMRNTYKSLSNSTNRSGSDGLGGDKYDDEEVADDVGDDDMEQEPEPEGTPAPDPVENPADDPGDAEEDDESTEDDHSSQKKHSGVFSSPLTLDNIVPFLVPLCGILSVLVAILLLLSVFKKRKSQKGIPNKTGKTKSKGKTMHSAETRRAKMRDHRVRYTPLGEDAVPDAGGPGLDGDGAGDSDDVLSAQERGEIGGNLDIVSRALHGRNSTAFGGEGRGLSGWTDRRGGVLSVVRGGSKRIDNTHRKVRSSV